MFECFIANDLQDPRDRGTEIGYPATGSELELNIALCGVIFSLRCRDQNSCRITSDIRAKLAWPA